MYLYPVGLHSGQPLSGGACEQGMLSGKEAVVAATKWIHCKILIFIDVCGGLAMDSSRLGFVLSWRPLIRI